MSRKRKIRKENIQIDQSGKIEQTNINTIVALTNSKHFSIILRKSDKRILETIFRKISKSKSYPFIVFSALLAIIIKLSDCKNKVTVDREYFGHENTIKERTLHFLRILGRFDDIIIEFGHVGKLSKAHDLAAKIGSKKLKPNKVVILKEILRLLFGEQEQKMTEVEKTTEGNLTQD